MSAPSLEHNVDASAAPFTPEQARWVHEVVASELARDTAYIMRVGGMARSAMLWCCGLLATGLIGFSALNFLALRAFEPPEKLIESKAASIKDELARHYKSHMEAATSLLNDKVTALQKEITTYSNENSEIIRQKGAFESQQNAIMEKLMSAERRIGGLLPDVEGALDTARASARRIEEFAQSVTAYSVADSIQRSEESVTKEVAARLMARSDFFQLIAANHIVHRLTLRLSETSCGMDELEIQSVSIDFKEGQDQVVRRTCLSMAEGSMP